MAKIIILSEYKDEIAAELSGEYELSFDFDGAIPDLLITDPDAIDENIPSSTRMLAVIHQNSPMYNVWDDFIVYPFRCGELGARVHSLLNSTFTNGALSIDFARCSVKVNDRPIHLTLLEYKLLCMLARCPGTTVQYELIMNELWESPIGSEILSIRVFINALRRKLGQESRLIKTVTGKGYTMPIITK